MLLKYLLKKRGASLYFYTTGEYRLCIHNKYAHTHMRNQGEVIKNV